MTAGPWRSHACVWGAVVPFPSYAFGPETSSGTFGRDAIFSTAGDERPGGMVQACGLCGLTAPGRVAGLAGVWSLGRASKAGRAGVELRALGTPATGAPPASAQKSWTDIVGPIFLRYVSQTEWCTLYKDVKALIRLGFFLHLFFNIFLSFTL